MLQSDLDSDIGYDGSDDDNSQRAFYTRMHCNMSGDTRAHGFKPSAYTNHIFVVSSPARLHEMGCLDVIGREVWDRGGSTIARGALKSSPRKGGGSPLEVKSIVDGTK